ncbi:uncharacterized protein EHS24_004693 [Apiotrichum porosum]|uniref:Uncharacterized protein n=1 Tax=Apiotrichum porosum TaxID=105984 RepID=A0A427Y5T4_9TREE|nr:uncharacterized protein EHS24_004693 [Apiotrichum porosum]RSH86438.1 hypothetical protein EHS24_004693 [Apiotrichum porosum]
MSTTFDLGFATLNLDLASTLAIPSTLPSSVILPPFDFGPIVAPNMPATPAPVETAIKAPIVDTTLMDFLPAMTGPVDVKVIKVQRRLQTSATEVKSAPSQSILLKDNGRRIAPKIRRVPPPSFPVTFDINTVPRRKDSPIPFSRPLTPFVATSTAPRFTNDDKLENIEEVMCQLDLSEGPALTSDSDSATDDEPAPATPRHSYILPASLTFPVAHIRRAPSVNVKAIHLPEYLPASFVVNKYTAASGRTPNPTTNSKEHKTAEGVPARPNLVRRPACRDLRRARRNAILAQ